MRSRPQVPTFQLLIKPCCHQGSACRMRHDLWTEKDWISRQQQQQKHNARQGIQWHPPGERLARVRAGTTKTKGRANGSPTQNMHTFNRMHIDPGGHGARRRHSDRAEGNDHRRATKQKTETLVRVSCCNGRRCPS